MGTRIIRLHLTTDDGAMLLTAPKRRARMFKARSAAVQEKSQSGDGCSATVAISEHGVRSAGCIRTFLKE